MFNVCVCVGKDNLAWQGQKLQFYVHFLKSHNTFCKQNDRKKTLVQYKSVLKEKV